MRNSEENHKLFLFSLSPSPFTSILSVFYSPLDIFYSFSFSCPRTHHIFIKQKPRKSKDTLSDVCPPPPSPWSNMEKSCATLSIISQKPRYTITRMSLGVHCAQGLSRLSEMIYKDSTNASQAEVPRSRNSERRRHELQFGFLVLASFGGSQASQRPTHAYFLAGTFIRDVACSSLTRPD